MFTVSFFGQNSYIRGKVGREENFHRHQRERVKETDLLSSVTSEAVVVGVMHLFNEEEFFPIE